MLFTDARGFDPATADVTFRLAASDYLDPLFLPQLVAQIKAQAPLLPHRHPSAVGRFRLPRAAGARARPTS
jgi:hypothetical protein